MFLKGSTCLLLKDRLAGKAGNREISQQAIPVVQTRYDGGVGLERSDKKCLASGLIHKEEPTRFTGDLPWGERGGGVKDD